MALQFGMSLDIPPVKREIESQDAISGGKSRDATLAALAIAFTESPREIAAFIDAHRERLADYVDANWLEET